jgi:hypothetical protein
VKARATAAAAASTPASSRIPKTPRPPQTPQKAPVILRLTKTPVRQLVVLSVEVEEEKLAFNADEPEYCRASLTLVFSFMNFSQFFTSIVNFVVCLGFYGKNLYTSRYVY